MRNGDKNVENKDLKKMLSIFLQKKDPRLVNKSRNEE